MLYTIAEPSPNLSADEIAAAEALSRAGRYSELNEAQRDALQRIALARDAEQTAVWLRQYPIGTRVRITKYDSINDEDKRRVGRIGVVAKGHSAGVYLDMDMTPRERTKKQWLILLDTPSHAIERLAPHAAERTSGAKAVVHLC